MKKILVISPFNIFPPYWGGANRIYNLIKFLANKYNIILLCNDYQQLQKISNDTKDFDELKSHPNIQIYFIPSSRKESQIFNYALIKKGLEIIKKEKPDFILSEFIYSALHAMILKFFTKTPFLLDEHNVEFLRYQRMKKRSRFIIFLLKKFEKLACNSALRVFCVSDVDKKFFISKLSINEDHIDVIPNGIDPQKFFQDQKKIPEIKKKLRLDDTSTILFFGKLDYAPNYQAVKIIHDKIVPSILKELPDAKFLIVGDNPPKEFSHNNIIFTGFVDNIEDYINASDVVISPLLSGGGTRLKILEAIACGKVVVSTTVGAEGIDQSQIKDFLKISDDWEEFSKEILSAISRKPSNVPHEFIQKYSWAQISEKVNQVLNSTDKGV